MARLLVLSMVISFCLATFSTAVSQPVLLGTLTPIFHKTSGTLYAIDEKTFFIQDFQYDGQGINVYVYVYLTGQTVDRAGGGTIINWSSTRTTVPRRRFRSENITISLTVDDSTADLNVSNIQAFTVWCEPFAVFFARLNLPTNVNIPGTGGPTIAPVVPSCVQLHSDFQVSWTHTDSHINIKQCGCIGEDQYMAFGISGSNTSTNMVGADVVVTWINDDGPNAIDYYLTSRQQCRAGQGVCPDAMISGGGGTQDVVNVMGIAVDGMRCIEYTRSLNTSDSNDRPYLVNNQTQFVAWAYGPRATEEGLRDLAFFHTEYPRNGANVELNFAESLRCGEPLQCMQEVVCDWEGLSITAMEPTAFTVKIGLSGGLRGYQAITGLSSWGIAYYINDTMAPVLKLRRHVTYTFIVEAGNDPNDGLRYHPFYITDSIDGGILLDSPEDRRRKNEQVYAGYNTETNEPTAAGRYCSHEETAESESVAMDCNSTLRDYLDTLNVSCVGAESDAAILTWTPDENTPDIVYYQCANHLHLGWRIVVMNGTTNFSTGVNNNTNTGMGNTTDTGIGNTTDTGIGNKTDTGMGNTTDTGIGNATNTTDIIDNLNCLQSVTLQKETVAFLKSELRLAEQLQQRQAEELNKLQQQLHNVSSLQSRKVKKDIPVIYMITPTHSRHTQKADLTRLCHTLMHVDNLHWIVVEDSYEKTSLVTRFLARCTVQSTHLNTRTDPSLQLRPKEPNWLRNRGVEQRNLAIDWLREHRSDETTGVVYFGDDDNTYDLQLFEEMRYTEKVAVWPVGICGGLRFEGPLCRDGKVTGWHTVWELERPFPLDMAGFAVGLRLLLVRKEAKMNQYAKRGYVESSLLGSLVNGVDELEAKADDCSKVLVWHTRTEKPKMTQEDQLISEGRPSNPNIET